MPITASALSTMIRLPARYMSCACSASNSSGPTVGSPTTIAVSASPETSAGSTPPMVLTIGLMAMRSGYLNSRRPSSSPLARPVSTYCLRSSSSSAARITRIRPAVPAVPITTSGIGRCLRKSNSLARFQGENSNSGENSPPTLQPR